MRQVLSRRVLTRCSGGVLLELPKYKAWLPVQLRGQVAVRGVPGRARPRQRCEGSTTIQRITLSSCARAKHCDGWRGRARDFRVCYVWDWHVTGAFRCSTPRTRSLSHTHKTKKVRRCAMALIQSPAAQRQLPDGARALVRGCVCVCASEGGRENSVACEGRCLR